MTEGAPVALAGWEDVQSRWRTLATEERVTVTTRLEDASALLRTAVPGIDVRVETDPTLKVLVASRVADAVIRYLRNPDGAKQLQETIGPRSYSRTVDGGPTGIFFTEEELAGLRPSAGKVPASSAVGTAIVGIRPGWGPL